MRNPLEKIQAQRVAIVRKLALAGLRVFPLKPNSKIPAIKGWQEAATSDPDKAGAWWVYNPDYNIGIHTIDHLVVDQDLKDDGPATWNEIVCQREMFGDEPAPTLTVWSGSGGIHEYYSLPPGKQVGNSTSTKFGRGIDIKSEGGLVVGPGSVIDGRTYDIIPTKKVKRGDLQKIMYPPEWMIQRAEAPRDRSKLAGVRVTPETPEAVAEAKRWLSEDAPEAVEGQGGDLATFKIAAKMFDLGLEFDTAMELVWDWNIEKAHPQWEYEALETKLQSGMINRQRAIGVDNPGAPPAGFESVDLGPGEEASIEKAPAEVQLAAIVQPPRSSWDILDFDEAADRARMGRDPIIEGVLYAGEISMAYGVYGTRKTMSVMDMVLHVTADRPWHGRAVTKGAGLWLAAEGGLGVYPRIDALRAHYKPGKIKFGVLERPLNFLSSEKDTLEVIKTIKRKEEIWGERLTLLVIDTLAAISAGSDEGIAATGLVMANVRKIRQAIGAHLHIMIIHHEGKTAGRGPRGTSALPSDIDTTIEVRKDSKTAGTLYLKKQRNGEDDLELLRFEAKTIALAPDDKGRAVTGQVIVPRVTSAMDEVAERLKGTDDERVLKALDAMLEEREEDERIPGTADFDHEFLMEAVEAAELVDSAGNLVTKVLTRQSANYRRVNRLLKRMSTSGHVCQRAKHQYFRGVTPC